MIMSKRIWIIGIMAVVLLVAAGTAIAYYGEDIFPSAGAKEQPTGEQPVGEQPIEAEAKLLQAEGTLVGRIDSHSLEIEIDGENKAFGLSDELRDEEFYSGPITVKYYEDKDGRSIITEADFAVPQRGEVATAMGIFSGRADNHTVEIMIDDEPRAFGLDQGISFDGIEEGDEVFIAYQENEQGRIVIVKVEKQS